MKKQIKNIAIITTIFSLFSSFSHAGIMEVVYAYESRGWTIHDIESTFLNEGETSSMFVFLEAGDRMIARGEGAADVKDLDVAVYLPNGRLLKRDQDPDPTPYVPFTAPVTGTYRIDVKIYSLWSGYGGAEAALVLAEK